MQYILQYILDLHPSKYILPSLQLNIKNFNFDNIQNLINLDYEQLSNSSIVQSKKNQKYYVTILFLTIDNVMII